MKPTDKLRAILRRHRRTLLAQADESSVKLTLAMERMERQIMRIIAQQGENGITAETLNRVVAQTNRVILEGNGQLAAWLRGELPAGALDGVRTSAEALAVPGAREATVSRIRAAFGNFEKGIKDRSLLRLGNQEIAGRWADMWNDRWDSTARSLQSTFLRSELLGSTWRDVAAEIEGPLGELGIAGRMDSESFARGFARAKLTEISNDTSIRFAQSLGVDKFVNIGVPDDRQSDECAGASAEEPMSLEDWQRSEWGLPPRHIFNCRCQMLGVVPEVEELFEKAERGELLEEAIA